MSASQLPRQLRQLHGKRSHLAKLCAFTALYCNPSAVSSVVNDSLNLLVSSTLDHCLWSSDCQILTCTSKACCL